MNPENVDLTSVPNLIKELFDNDEWVKKRFNDVFANEVMELAEVLSQCFARLPWLGSEVKDERGHITHGFVFGVLDDLVTSTKLLLSGKQFASGNLLRQAIEGIAVAILCAHDGEIEVFDKKTKQKIKVIYWKALVDKDSRVQSHKAIDHLENNLATLDVNEDALDQLRSGRRWGHQFSHPNLLGNAMRITLSTGQAFIGGAYDDAKEDAYRNALEHRIGFAKILPGAMDVLAHRLGAQN